MNLLEPFARHLLMSVDPARWTFNKTADENVGSKMILFIGN